MLWASKDAKDREVDFDDTSHEKEIKNESPSKIRPLGNPFENPTTALAKAWKGLGQSETVPSMASG